jgi:hypothetical protein
MVEDLRRAERLSVPAFSSQLLALSSQLSTNRSPRSALITQLSSFNSQHSSDLTA